MTTKETLLSENLTRVNDWIKFADAKAGAIAAISAIYLGFSKNVFESYYSFLVGERVTHANLPIIALATLAVAMLFYSLSRTIFFLLLAVRARTVNKDYNLLFFGHIAQKTAADYAALVRSRTAADLLRDIIAQTHTNSVIATKKYRYVNEAIVSIAVATLSLLIAGIALAVMNQ